MIGFVAGVAAALGLGLQKLIDIGKSGSLADGDIQLLLGIMAAGYVGTDFIESFLPTITKAVMPKPSGRGTPPDPRTEDKGDTPAVDAGPQTKASALAVDEIPAAKPVVAFGSLVAGGLFSRDPYDLNVCRAVRTNNPGALNLRAWQKKRPGYVGFTEPDYSPDGNVTTIYRTPEHGVAAWYHLLAVRYAFPNGVFTLHDLAIHYAGSPNDSRAIETYVEGWSHWFGSPISATAQIGVKNRTAMLELGKAMFSHEAGKRTPVHDDQIAFAIDHECAGTLPN